MEIKKIGITIIILGVLIVFATFATNNNYENLTVENYEIVWEDNFENENLNTNNWTYVIGGHGWWNKELQYYTDREKNIRIENNKLIIEAHEEEYKSNEYTSARIKTQNKKHWKYGKIEAKMKLPQGQGLWPAFWMLGQAGSWPEVGEIDIMEMVGGGPGYDDTIYGTAHYTDPDDELHSFNGSYILNGKIFADDFHVFGMVWTSEKIRWFVDGKQYHSMNITDKPGMNKFRENMYIILNVAVGGEWPGNPDHTTEFPQQMILDWVRVSKKQ